VFGDPLRQADHRRGEQAPLVDHLEHGLQVPLEIALGLEPDAVALGRTIPPAQGNGDPLSDAQFGAEAVGDQVVELAGQRPRKDDGGHRVLGLVVGLPSRGGVVLEQGLLLPGTLHAPIVRNQPTADRVPGEIALRAAAGA
jgi:hypothetical protein